MGASMSEYDSLTQCPCGYSLTAAKKWLTADEISLLMARHYQSNHVVIETGTE
jgi:hypothetical protein